MWSNTFSVLLSFVETVVHTLGQHTSKADAIKPVKPDARSAFAATDDYSKQP
jgi:hypothetical protein